jgi:glucokinase
MTCLIGDIGATNARFAIVAPDLKMEELRVYRSSEYDSFSNVVQTYLEFLAQQGLPRPTEAKLAIAAPVSKHKIVTFTNLNWSFSKDDLQAILQFKVDLYNDLSAVALAVPYLDADDKLKLGDTVPSLDHAVSDDAIAIIAPGSGLGAAGLIRAANRWIDVGGEGGHATMAAATREETQVLDLLRLRWDHVSAERVLSGPGLANLYEAVCILHGIVGPKLAPEQITAALLKTNGTREQTGLICGKAFDLFCSMLGTVAGNMALTLGATGGVYIAGGILPRVKDRLAASSFRRRFEQRGRLTDYMKRIPTYLILHKVPALLGLIHA